jgi:hypothetical protein
VSCIRIVQDAGIAALPGVTGTPNLTSRRPCSHCPLVRQFIVFSTCQAHRYLYWYNNHSYCVGIVERQRVGFVYSVQPLRGCTLQWEVQGFAPPFNQSLKMVMVQWKTPLWFDQVAPGATTLLCPRTPPIGPVHFHLVLFHFSLISPEVFQPALMWLLAQLPQHPVPLNSQLFQPFSPSIKGGA